MIGALILQIKTTTDKIYKIKLPQKILLKVIIKIL